MEITKKQEREILELMGFFKDTGNTEAYLNGDLDINLSDEAITAYFEWKAQQPKDEDA